MCTRLSDKCNLFLAFLLYYAAAVASQDVEVNTIITIPLNGTTTEDNKEIYGEFIQLQNSSTVQINFSDIDSDLRFILFQVHSHIYGIDLYKTNLNKPNQVNGTNVGQISMIAPNNKKIQPDRYFIRNPYQNRTLRLYISVHGYEHGDPIPGGCNMEFPGEIAPYIGVTTNTDYITVAAPAASLDPKCEKNGSNITIHMMYLPERSFDADAYFTGIRTLMSLKGIKEKGIKLQATSVWKSPIRWVSAYAETGAIFVAVAHRNDVKDSTQYSVYVPNHSYGCPEWDEDGCDLPYDFFLHLLSAVLLFVGLFITFLGHRFFKTEMFLAGFFSGFIITYILVSILENSGLGTPALIAASTISGIFFGAIWLLFWWLYGIPVISVLLPSLNFGFLAAAGFYYVLPPFVTYLELDLNFWSLFIMIMSLMALVVVFVAYVGNILCCAVLGAFASSFALDYFLGSNIKYIIINTVRRAVVPKFNKVILAPPYQWRDQTVITLWVLTAVIGMVFQHWHNRGRPPFPPPPRSTRLVAPELSSDYYGAIGLPTPASQTVPFGARIRRYWSFSAGPRHASIDERTRLLPNT